MVEFHRFAEQSKMNRKSIKTRCKIYADRSSIHGVPDISSVDNFGVKLFWLLCVLGACGYLAIEINRILQEYLEEQTVSKMNVIMSDPFPQTMFCPKQWIDKGKLKSQLPEGVDVESTIFLINKVFPLPLFSSMEIEAPDIVDYEDYVFKNFDADKITAITANLDVTDIKDFILAISKDIPISCGCQVECQTEKIMSLYGLCYKLVLNKQSTSMSSSAIYNNPFQYIDRQVYISLFPNQTKCYKNKIPQPPVSKAEPDTTGTIFLLVGQETLIYPSAAIRLSQGRKYVFSYQSTHTKRVSTSYHVCKNYNTYQEVGDCMVQCINTNLCSKIGNKCQLLAYNSSGNFDRYCNYLDGSNHCIYPFLEDRNMTIYNFCSDECPHPCETTYYQVTRSINSEYPEADFVFDSLNGGAVLSIQESKLYTWSTLLSNIGGMISLCCGASLLSFVQIISICCLETGVWKWMGDLRKQPPYIEDPRSSISSLYHDVVGDIRRPSVAFPRSPFPTSVHDLPKTGEQGYM